MFESLLRKFHVAKLNAKDKNTIKLDKKIYHLVENPAKPCYGNRLSFDHGSSGLSLIKSDGIERFIYGRDL